MPLTIENNSALVGGAAAPAMQKRWVKVLRTFVGSDAAVGDVVEMSGAFAAELAAANKVAFTTAPATETPAPEAEPVSAPTPAAAPRRGRHSKES